MGILLFRAPCPEPRRLELEVEQNLHRSITDFTRVRQRSLLGGSLGGLGPQISKCHAVTYREAKAFYEGLLTAILHKSDTGSPKTASHKPLSPKPLDPKSLNPETLFPLNPQPPLQKAPP